MYEIYALRNFGQVHKCTITEISSIQNDAIEIIDTQIGTRNKSVSSNSGNIHIISIEIGAATLVVTGTSVYSKLSIAAAAREAGVRW